MVQLFNRPITQLIQNGDRAMNRELDLAETKGHSGFVLRSPSPAPGPQHPFLKDSPFPCPFDP